MTGRRLTTPPSQSGSLGPTIHSTPLNQGASSNSSYNTKTNVSDYYPYLQEDLRNCATISFEEFLKYIFGIKLDSTALARASQIAHGVRFRKLMDKYCEEVTDETGRYAPFVELVNYVFDQVGKSPIRLCRNDSTLLWGSYAGRKPDVLGVLKDAFKQGGRINADYLSKKGPGNADAFHWGEALCFWEFKLLFKSRAEYNKLTTPKASVETKARNNEKIPARSGPSNAHPSNLLAPNRRSSRAATMRNTQDTDKAVESYASGSQKKRSSSSNSDQMSKRTRADRDIDSTDLQCAGYALEMFSNGNLFSHVISSLITDFKIQLLYYDHSLNARSQPLDFITDRTKFVEMLMAYSELSLRALGLATEITPRFISPSLKKGNDARRPFTSLFIGQKLQLPGAPVIITLKSTIFRQHALIGRGTSVFRVDVSPPTPPVAVLKVSWPSQKRRPEWEYIRRALGLAESNSRDKRFKNNLPTIIYGQGSPPGERDAHYRIVNFLNSKEPNKYELRELRVFVQEVLFPITELKDARQVKSVFHEILTCHHWLYTVAKILHRDISLGNLMFRREGNRIYGVLNDFDLACFVDGTERHPESNQRTGTRPFMSIDLINPSSPVKHLYRHDLESFFYVLMFFAARYRDGKEIDNPPLQEWLTLGGRALEDHKGYFISKPLPSLTPQFAALRWHLLAMRGTIFNGHTERSRYEQQEEILSPGFSVPSFNHETLGGHLTFKAFHDIFSTELKG